VSKKKIEPLTEVSPRALPEANFEAVARRENNERDMFPFMAEALDSVFLDRFSQGRRIIAVRFSWCGRDYVLKFKHKKTGAIKAVLRLEE
jgi:hypothetical protein